MRSRTLPVGEIGLEQRLFQRLLQGCALKPGPVQQAVRIKSVVDAAAATAGLVGLAEGKTHTFTAQANVFSVGIGLRWRDAVLLRDVLGNFLAFGGHLRIELKRLEMQRRRHVARHARKRLLQRLEADGAPRAGNIRNKIYLE